MSPRPPLRSWIANSLSNVAAEGALDLVKIYLLQAARRCSKSSDSSSSLTFHRSAIDASRPPQASTQALPLQKRIGLRIQALPVQTLAVIGWKP